MRGLRVLSGGGPGIDVFSGTRRDTSIRQRQTGRASHVAVIVASPAPAAVTRPAASTFATFSSEEW